METKRRYNVLMHSVPHYDPQEDYVYVSYAHRLSEDERTYRNTALKHWPALQKAAAAFAKSVKNDQPMLRFAFHYNPGLEKLLRIAESDKPQNISGETIAAAAYAEPAQFYLVTADMNASRGESEAALKRLLQSAGVTQAFGALEQEYQNRRKAWDMNPLLQCCADFAARVSDAELDAARNYLIHATGQKNEAIFPSQALIRSRTKGELDVPAFDAKDGDKRKGKPKSIFDAQELFAHAGRRCGYYRDFPEEMMGGLRAARSLGEMKEPMWSTRSGAAGFWFLVARVQNMAQGLSSPVARASLDGLAAADKHPSDREDAQKLAKVLAAFDASGLARAVRSVFEGQGASLGG